MHLQPAYTKFVREYVLVHAIHHNLRTYKIYEISWELSSIQGVRKIKMSR